MFPRIGEIILIITVHTKPGGKVKYYRVDC